MLAIEAARRAAAAGRRTLFVCYNAMLARWIEDGVDPAHVSVIRPSGAPCGDGIRVTADYPEDEVPAIVLLGMKPYQLDLVAPLLALATASFQWFSNTSSTSSVVTSCSAMC